MANFRGHVTTSGFLGLGYGVGATMLGGFTPMQGALAGCLTAVGGMLPDLDLENSTPSRELFALTAAVAPLVLMPRLMHWGGGYEGAMFLAVVIYLVVRYLGATIVGKLTVHRGMFHSIPALFIVAELVFLGYRSDQASTRFLMAGAVATGFLSHLILDEIFSVQFTGIRFKLAKSAGSALKFMGSNVLANLFSYALLCALTYGVLIEGGWMRSPVADEGRGLFQQVQRAAESLKR